jgi:hypothetical protein
MTMAPTNVAYVLMAFCLHLLLHFERCFISALGDADPFEAPLSE